MRIPPRWLLCLLLFGATTLCFLDRQVLSVLSPEICQEFQMTEQDYSYVTNGFLISYALMFFLGGVLIDLLGTRWGLGISVLIWTIASALHAVIRTPFQMGAARFLLGAGEGGCFPGAAKAAAEWFPQKERALATGIAIGGASLGGLIAPPLTLYLHGYFGWRGAFVATGLFGLAWCLLWFAFYHWAGRPTLETTSPEAKKEAEESPQTFSWRAVLGLSLGRFLFDPVFYFYMFWIPKYLKQDCGATPEIIALTGIPFLAMGVTNIIGGVASDFLVRRGVPVLSARKWVMMAAAGITLASAFVPLFKGNAYVAIFLMSMLMFGHGFWITNFVAIVSDHFPKNRVATVMGISGLVGTIGGLLGNTAIGWVADNVSFVPVWIVSGLLYPAAFGVILLTIRKGRKGTYHENRA
ncbi:MAG: MFS transporter [Planctomycetia bacterium]|nr:MFS transporter [Planctomycetia bacterium]